MKRLLSSVIAGLVLALPMLANGGPDETQRRLIESAQEAKRKLAAARSADGASRQQMMREHMQTMQEIVAQMQKARPAQGLTPQQMREWIDEHIALMQQVMGQMMDEHHLLMQGADGKGMGMREMHKK